MATWMITAVIPDGGGVQELVRLVEGLRHRPGKRAGNVLSFNILRATEFAEAGQPTRYLVLLDIDHRAARALATLADEAAAVLPDGCDVTGVEFETVIRSARRDTDSAIRSPTEPTHS
jgi:hypothetical protein